MTVKEEALQYMKSPKTTTRHNMMGCSEDWYNPYYAIFRTFSFEEVQAMPDEEVERLVKLGDAIAEGLY